MTLQRLQAYADAVGAAVMIEVLPAADERFDAMRRLNDVWSCLSAAERAALLAMLEVWERQHCAPAATRKSVQ